MVIKQRVMSVVRIAIICGLIVMAYVLWRQQQRVAGPESRVFPMSAGDLIRTVQLAPHDKAGKPAENKRLDYLEFKSSNGPIEIEVFPFAPMNAPPVTVAIAAPQKNGEDFTFPVEPPTPVSPPPSEQSPDEPLAKMSTDSGQIDLSHWQAKQQDYVVQMRSERDTKVELKIIYQK